MDLKYFLYFALVLYVNKINANEISEVKEMFEVDDDDMIDISSLGPEVFGRPDPLAGEKLAKWTPSHNSSNAEEQGTYFEGDILFEKPKGRQAITVSTNLWIGGIVYYVIEGTYSSSELSIISSAMNAISSVSSVTFVMRTTQADYVAITGLSAGCYSSIGRVGGRQTMNLQSPGCFAKVGTAIHELLHTLGFFHENNRWDRDSYITVQYANVISGQSSKFDKISSAIFNTAGRSYDWGSIMHYSEYAYSSNGQKTIVALGAGTTVRNIGQRDGLSANDVLAIRVMYGSSGSNGGSGSASTVALFIDLLTCIQTAYSLIVPGGTLSNLGFETND